MALPDIEHFTAFVQKRKKDLQRIARATQREADFSDVVNEAYLLTHDLAERDSSEFSLTNNNTQELILRYLYQKLVRYTETHIRHGIKLDHYREEEDDCHPVMKALAGNPLAEPLAYLENAEESRKKVLPVPSSSRAVAFLKVLNRFGGNMPTIADFLMISLSHCYRCYARAVLEDQIQNSLDLHDNLMTDGELRPWRKFKIQRQPEQLPLPLNERLNLLV